MSLSWLLVALTSPALGQTVQVCASGCVYDTIQGAIDDDATNAATIEVGQGVWNESVSVSRSVSIVAPGGPVVTSVVPMGMSSFLVAPGVVAHIEGFTVHPNTGPAIYVASTGSVDLVDIQMAWQVSDFDGSALYVSERAEASIDDSWFSSNATDGLGIVYVGPNGTVQVTNSTFELNASCRGGAIYGNGAYVSVGATLFATNSAEGFCQSIEASGGAIAVDNGGTVAITSSTFVGNQADLHGGHVSGGYDTQVTADTGTRFYFGDALAGAGGAIALPGSDASLYGSRFLGNAAATTGGAVAAWGSWYLGLQGAYFDSNEADRGGAVSFAAPDFGSGTVQITETTFHDNWADIEGGGLYVPGDPSPNSSAYLTITETSFLRNGAGSGGGMSVVDLASLAVQDSYFCGNHTSQGPGAGALVGASTSATPYNWRRIVFSENNAAGAGGAAAFQGGNISFSQAHVLGGSANAGGGLAFENGATASIDHVLVAEVAGGSGIWTDEPGNLTLSFNAYWNNDYDHLTWSATPSTIGFGQFVAAPQLVDYSRDGDCFNDDFRPQDDPTIGISPLIDAGNPGLMDIADNSPWDVGAFTGTTNDQFGAWQDSDGDGAIGLIDCHDGDPAVHMGAPEICNDGVDDNCNSLADDQDWTLSNGTVYYPDGDGDGYGGEPALGTFCTQPAESTDLSGDCNDEQAAIGPQIIEVPYNGLDDDCDAETSDTDVDGDGYHASEVDGPDCDDTDPGIHPAAREIPYDGVDQDCRDGDLTDVDGDGFIGAEGGGTDCDDLDPSVRPDADEHYYDGVDQDCDGASDFDRDLDGFDSDRHTPSGTDCDDDAAEIHPGAEELLADGIDQDCDTHDVVAFVTGGGGCRTSGGPVSWTLVVLGLVGLCLRKPRAGRPAN